jgi:hypothetical protein
MNPVVIQLVLAGLLIAVGIAAANAHDLADERNLAASLSTPITCHDVATVDCAQ